MSASITYTELAAKGFERITNWELYKDRIKLKSLTWKDNAGWIYAFVVEGRVRYVGITTMILRSRLDGYRNHIGDKVREYIKASLLSGHEVEIFGVRRSNIESIDLAKEESWLINEFKTDWNVRK